MTTVYFKIYSSPAAFIFFPIQPIVRIMKVYAFILLPILIFSQPLYSQVSSDASSDEEKPAAAAEEVTPAELPDGYRSLRLGMTLEELKESLLTEPRFDFRGDPDVSVRKSGTQSLIVSKGKSFIDTGYFQFDEGRLYLIILELDGEKMDFFTMQKRLTENYGTPGTLSPEGMSWSDEKTRISLEYPLTVKYLDLDTFNGFMEDEVRRKSFEEISRTKFLEDF